MTDGMSQAQLGLWVEDPLFTLGWTDLAPLRIKKALSYDPDNPRYHYSLGLVYFNRNEWEDAVREHKLALEKEPRNREYLRALGEAIFSSGDKKTGVEYLHEVVPLYPNDSGILAELASAYTYLGDMDSAKRYAEEAMRVNPDDVMAHTVLWRIEHNPGGCSD